MLRERQRYLDVLKAFKSTDAYQYAVAGWVKDAKVRHLATNNLYLIREKLSERERDYITCTETLLVAFSAAKRSMTFSLKLSMLRTSSLSMESMASAFRRSWPIAFRRNVLILFKVEKHLSASAVVIGVVMRMFNKLTVSENVSWRL